MATIYTYFYEMPSKVAKQYAKLVNGEVVECTDSFSWIEMKDKTAPLVINIEIAFYLDTPENSRKLDLENRTLVHGYKDPKIRIYRSPKRPFYCPYYLVLLHYTPTARQAYKAYLICENITYLVARQLGFLW